MSDQSLGHTETSGRDHAEQQLPGHRGPVQRGPHPARHRRHRQRHQDLGHEEECPGHRNTGELYNKLLSQLIIDYIGPHRYRHWHAIIT